MRLWRTGDIETHTHTLIQNVHIHVQIVHAITRGMRGNPLASVSILCCNREDVYLDNHDKNNVMSQCLIQSSP